MIVSSSPPFLSLYISHFLSYAIIVVGLFFVKQVQEPKVIS